MIVPSLGRVEVAALPDGGKVAVRLGSMHAMVPVAGTIAVSPATVRR